MTMIRCVLDEAACISRHQPGILQGEKVLLFSEWNDLASAVTRRLQQGGVTPGDRVSVFMANDWRTLVIITGIIRAGAVACPLSTRLPRKGVIEQIRQIESRFLVAFLSEQNRDDLLGITVFSPDVLLDTPGQPAGQVATIDINQSAMILFTSGTSGKPRAAVLSYGNLYYNAQGANANLRLRSNDRWLLNLPLYHVSGIGVLFRCIMGGASIIIPSAEETTAQAIMQYKPSHVSLVPMQLAELLDEPEGNQFGTVRVFLVGGSAADDTLLEKARKRMWPVYLTYGMTEMGSQITTIPMDAPPAVRFTTSGKVLRHRQIRITPEREIQVKGACLFQGYLTKDDIVRELDAEGWFSTGDIGVINDTGYLTVLGRKDHLIISGGENIQPHEIESHLMAIPEVENAVVVGVPHLRYGQRPVAFIKAAVMDDSAWRKRLLQVLPAFKIPDAFYPWPPEADESGIKVSRAVFVQEAMRLHSRKP